MCRSSSVNIHTLLLCCSHIPRPCSSLGPSQQSMSRSPTHPIVSWGMQPFMAVLAPSHFLRQDSCCNDPHMACRLRSLRSCRVLFCAVLVPHQVPSVLSPALTSLASSRLFFLTTHAPYVIRPACVFALGRHLLCPRSKVICHLARSCLNVDGCLLDVLSDVLCHSPRLLLCGSS